MPIFSGNFSVKTSTQNSPFFDNDEDSIVERASGQVKLVVQYTATGQIAPNAFGTASVSAGAYGVNEQDVDVDGFSDFGTGNLQNIGGSLNGQVSFGFSFGSNGGTGSFTGSLDASGNFITGTATVSDNGMTLTAPLTLNAGGGTTSANGQVFLAQMATVFSQEKGIVSFGSFAIKLYNAAVSAGLDLPSFFSILQDPAFKQLGVQARLLSSAASGINIGTEISNGNWAGALADLGVFYTKLALNTDLDTFIVEGGLAVETPPGAAIFALGVSGRAATLIFDKQLSNVLRTDYVALLNKTGIPGNSHPLNNTAVAEASLSSSTATQGTTVTFPTGYSPVVFDPGYYLSHHSDAVAAVASGAYASAYDFYLAVGINRGDIPAAGKAAVSPSGIPDLAAQASALGPYSTEYAGIFELPLGALPTDGLSVTEASVGAEIFSGPAAPVTTVKPDTGLTAAADRYAIDLARNQSLSGIGGDYFGSTLPTFSNGVTVASLLAETASSYRNISVYVHSATPQESLAEVEAAIQQDMAASLPTASRGYGIAEYGGVWVVIAGDPASGSVQTPSSEATGPSTFYGTSGDDQIFPGWHSFNIDGGPGNDTVVFPGGRSSYSITQNSAGATIVTDTRPGGSTYSLSNVENLVFSGNFLLADTSTGQSFQDPGVTYSGPVSGLQYQYLSSSPDNLNVTSQAANAFIHTGSGFDAIDVSHVGGINVLDGGTNSNFLVGGTGASSFDTFFVDDRNPSSDIWSTVANFHAGDAATVFGIQPAGFNVAWFDGQGATGYTGLTLHVTAPGQPTASLTLSGYSTSDLQNGRITTSFGTELDGTPYFYILGH